MKKAMEGKTGKCIGFVGLPGAANAMERIQGYNEAVAGTGLELIDVRGDDIDQTRARANVDDVLVANPDVNCMVGFYSYNPPRMYEALRDAGKLGSITVVGFDEDPITLGAVKEGSFAGTVVQQPWVWGYEGSKLIANYLKGDKSGIPADGIIIIPGLTITTENVDAFQADLQEKLSRLNK
jgi:ribose transport system substrate-binding protein